MKKVDFQNALMSTIVEYISDQIILKYMEASKKAVVLFTGALIGYADAVKSLNDLQEKGWEFTAVLSKAAAEVLTEERIKKDINPKTIFVEGAPINGKQIVAENQFVIIPTLTINTASKLSNCIFDNPVTNIVSYALHAGKPIVAAVDGCCPDNKVREKIGFKVPEAYKKKLRDHLVDLQTYGILLTTDQNLSEKVETVFSASFDFSVPQGKVENLSGISFNPENVLSMVSGMMSKVSDTVVQATAPEKAQNAFVVSQPAVEQTESIYLDKKVIGRIDIAKNARYRVIEVSSDALVTGLATDEASQRGISIVRK